MTRRPPTVEAARDEAIKLGAEFTYEHGSKHIIGTIYFNGQQRKTSLSKSPSDRLALHKIRKFVRRSVAQMSGAGATQQEEQ